MPKSDKEGRLKNVAQNQANHIDGVTSSLPPFPKRQRIHQKNHRTFISRGS